MHVSKPDKGPKRAAGEERRSEPDAGVTSRMQRQARKNTRAEVQLRAELHRRGLRYRIHRRPVPDLRREADIVFGPARVAVFVDGCFWHACPTHASWPKTNAAWWRKKILRNVERDRETDTVLAQHGWATIRVWEHEDPAESADRVEEAVRRRNSGR